ncbi:hypothetical protein LTR86_011098 [Recurvomyces mirabilis]|nr:hypothetical protein LTR86_011098 [Recurvomyces mirabilis]
MSSPIGDDMTVQRLREQRPFAELIQLLQAHPDTLEAVRETNPALAAIIDQNQSSLFPQRHQVVGGRKRGHFSDDSPRFKKLRKLEKSDRIFLESALLECILLHLPRNQAVFFQRVCKGVQQTMKYGAIQEYLHGIPSTRQCGQRILQWRREKISDFISLISTSVAVVSKTTQTACIHGYGGEMFMDPNEPAYQTLRMGSDIVRAEILQNSNCQRPCLIDTGLTQCHLNPGPLKRLMCALLVKAWYSKDEHHYAMQPETFRITCTAILDSITFTKFRMPPDFSKPKPLNTFEATISYVFLEMATNTESRSDGLSYGKFSNDTAKGMVLCRKGILDNFRVARSASWTLEQMCFIVDRIPEEHFVKCRDECAEIF